MKIYLKAVKPKIWKRRCNECWFAGEECWECKDGGKNKFPCLPGEKYAGKIAVLATPEEIERYERRMLLKDIIDKMKEEIYIPKRNV
jgi:hypothetical protein